jgi:hypothetical protein
VSSNQASDDDKTRASFMVGEVEYLEVELLEAFNSALESAAERLGARQEDIDEALSWVGMPSEWRGAVLRIAELVDRCSGGDEAGNLLGAICRIVPKVMSVAPRLVPPALMVGAAVLESIAPERCEQL